LVGLGGFQTCCGATPDQDFVVHERRIVARLKQELEDIEREQRLLLEMEQTQPTPPSHTPQDAWAQPPGTSNSFLEQPVEDPYDRWLRGKR
jgi:hypothetical protein